jgi:hypothetical protein
MKPWECLKVPWLDDDDDGDLQWSPKNLEQEERTWSEKLTILVSQ